MALFAPHPRSVWLFHHLTVRAKGIERGGQQIIGLADPVTAICYDLARTVYIVVIAIDLNQTGIGLDAIDIVI